MRKARFGGLLASTALAGATILGGAGIASAQDTATVEFNAVGGEDCTVEFTLKHPSTSPDYQIDYQINGEFNEEGQTWAAAEGEKLDKDKQEGPTRWGPTSKASDTSTETVNLQDLEDLEVNEEGKYLIEYRLLFGPATHTASEVKKVTVTGCVDENANEDKDEDKDKDKDNPLDDIFGSVKGSANLPDFNLDSLRANLSS